MANAFGVHVLGLKLVNAFGVHVLGLKLVNALGVHVLGLKLVNAFGVRVLGLKLANAFGVRVQRIHGKNLRKLAFGSVMLESNGVEEKLAGYFEGGQKVALFE